MNIWTELGLYTDLLYKMQLQKTITNNKHLKRSECIYRYIIYKLNYFFSPICNHVNLCLSHTKGGLNWGNIKNRKLPRACFKDWNNFSVDHLNFFSWLMWLCYTCNAVCADSDVLVHKKNKYCTASCGWRLQHVKKYILEHSILQKLIFSQTGTVIETLLPFYVLINVAVMTAWKVFNADLNYQETNRDCPFTSMYSQHHVLSLLNR